MSYKSGNMQTEKIIKNTPSIFSFITRYIIKNEQTIPKIECVINGHILTNSICNDKKNKLILNEPNKNKINLFQFFDSFARLNNSVLIKQSVKAFIIITYLNALSGERVLTSDNTNLHTR